MDEKLTLKLNKNAIGYAKKYAVRNNTSVSRVVEKFFKGLELKDSAEDVDIPARIKEITGVVKGGDLKNHKDAYSDYLIRKYI
jgi:16S rRNA U516 pseudouridylate synthase RsuA-like enzyme